MPKITEKQRLTRGGKTLNVSSGNRVNPEIQMDAQKSLNHNLINVRAKSKKKSGNVYTKRYRAQTKTRHWQYWTSTTARWANTGLYYKSLRVA